MDHIEQGSIIYGIRSDRYSEIRCYAILISARCDIANEKISKLYYLTGVNAKEWFCTKWGYNQIIGRQVKNHKTSCEKVLDQYDLNIDVMLDFSLEESLELLKQQIGDASKQKKVCTQFEALYKEIKAEESQQERKKNILQNGQKLAVQILKDICAGKVTHYFYLPQNTYLNNQEEKISENGLIVDLQEIGIMEMKDARNLESPGIDCRTLELESKSEKERLKAKYWLEDDDFVGIDGIIKSPWCELLMQRFAYDFTRIGVDAPGNDDFEKLVKEI